MSGKKEEEKVEEVLPKADAKPEVLPKADAKPEVLPKADAKPEAKVGEIKEPKRVRLADLNSDLPDDETLMEMTTKDLKRHLNVTTGKELKKRFGTGDFDEIKAKLDKLATYEKDDEERKRKEMTESDRLKADYEKEKRRADEADRRYRMTLIDRAADKYETHVSKILEKQIDTDFIDDSLLNKLATFLSEEHGDEVKANKVKDSTIEKWAKEQVEKRPKLGRDFTPPKKEDPKPEKKPLNNGAKTDDRPPAAKGVKPGGKSYAPSAENAMSTGEAKAEAAKEGYRW